RLSRGEWNGGASPRMRIQVSDRGGARELKVLRDLVCLRPIKGLPAVQVHLIVAPAPQHTRFVIELKALQLELAIPLIALLVCAARCSLGGHSACACPVHVSRVLVPRSTSPANLAHEAGAGVESGFL